MIAMPPQNASWRLKSTRSRRLPRQYSTQASRNVARKTHENSHGTAHFNSVAITIRLLLLPSAPATADQHRQRRHQHDVDHLQAQPERIDLGIELVLHVAQFLVDRQLALAELLDL